MLNLQYLTLNCWRRAAPRHRAKMPNLLPWLADRRATVMVEFAIIGPVFLFLLFAIFGVGLDGFYQLTLDDAVRGARPRLRDSFGRDRKAVVMVEFAIVGPIFLLLLFAILGVGLDGFYQLTLDDAVRDAARQLQIDGPAAGSGASFATAICKEFSPLAPSCTTKISYYVQTSATTYSQTSATSPTPAITPFASIPPVALPASGSFTNTFPAGFSKNVSIVVQVAYPLPFSLPFVGPLITNTGTNSILAVTTVLAEPLS